MRSFPAKKTAHSVFFVFAVIFRVYGADHTYCTLRFPMCTTAEVIKACAADKLKLNRSPDDLLLVELNSNGERNVLKDHDVSVPTALCLNGRIFVAPKDHLDSLVSGSARRVRLQLTNDCRRPCQTPLPEQEGPTDGIDMDLEALSTKELAYYITQFDWDLFCAVHEYELLYQTFGRHHFGKVCIFDCTETKSIC